MLERLLQRIASGGLHSLDELARELDVSRPLLDAMVADLERMGYLRKISTLCEAGCEHCPSQGLCTLLGSGQAWTLSEKGMRAAGHSQSLSRSP